MRIKYILTLLVLVFCSLGVSAQGPTSNWFFGDSCGLRFVNGIASENEVFKLSASEASTSLSNLKGELIAYANPSTLYHSNHNLLINGDGLEGMASSSQGALLIPHPVNSSIIYMISQGGGGLIDSNLFYSEIRFNPNQPLGFVPSGYKNQSLNLLGGGVSERLTAVHHANGRDIWLVSRKRLSDTIFSYLISDEGINPIPVVSPIELAGQHSAGQIKSSPNGKFILETAYSYLNDTAAMVHHFNNETGVVSSGVAVLDSISSYGVEFSANSEFIYLSNYNILFNYGLCRYNLGNFNETQIQQSKEIVGDTGKHIMALQIGVNRNIYGVSIYDQPAVYEVKNAEGAIPIFESQNFNFTTGEPRWGLPDFIQSYFRPAYFDYTKACFGDSTEFISQTVGEDSLKWNFGEPSSGALNFSTEKYPKHLYSQAGEYNVTLIAYADSSIDTFSRLIQIKPPLNGMDYLGDVICDFSPFSLHPNPNQPWSNHLWMDSIWQDSFLIADAGTYWATIWNDCDTLTDTIYVSNDAQLNLSLLDTFICSPLAFNIYVPDSANTWLWSDGDTTSNFKTFQQDTGSVTVWLEASNSCGTVTDTATVTFIPSPNTDWFTDSILCGLEAPIIAAPTSNWMQFVLQNPAMDTLNPWLINDAGNYLLTAFNECDTVQKTAYLSPNQLIGASLPPQVALCPGEEVVLDASWPNATYVWSLNNVVDTSLIDSVVTRFYPEETEVVEVEVTSQPCVKRLQTIVSPFVADSCAPCAFEVPNVFSPNGDGINDVLHISNACSYQEFTFFIYNRWGQLVHTSDQSIPTWDGSIQGTPAAEGAYFIVVEYTDENGVVASVRNAVSLLR